MHGYGCGLKWCKLCCDGRVGFLHACRPGPPRGFEKTLITARDVLLPLVGSVGLGRVKNKKPLRTSILRGLDPAHLAWLNGKPMAQPLHVNVVALLD